MVFIPSGHRCEIHSAFLFGGFVLAFARTGLSFFWFTWWRVFTIGAQSVPHNGEIDGNFSYTDTDALGCISGSAFTCAVRRPEILDRDLKFAVLRLLFSFIYFF